MTDQDPEQSNIRNLLVAVTVAIIIMGGGIYSMLDSGDDDPEQSNNDIIPVRPYAVVDTGQTVFYDDSKTISKPVEGDPFFGQDAQYEGYQPNYTLGKDGLTVYDQVTGLIWTKSPDWDGDGNIDSNDKFVFADFLAYPDTLNEKKFGGFDDWRAPNIKELYSLIDFMGTDPPVEGDDATGLVPFIDTDYFNFGYGDTGAGERVIDSQFWSSTEYVFTTMGSIDTTFGVNFADGRIKGYGRTDPQGKEMDQYALFVRGNTDYGTNVFIDNSDGTITDNATGLMWTQDDNGEGVNCEDALAWTQQKNDENYLGHEDWRLPNVKELQSIVDYSRAPDTTSSPAIDSLFSCTGITNEDNQADYGFYWSGTTHLSFNGNADRAAYVSFGRGMGQMNGETMDVHGAGCQRSDPKDGDSADYPKLGQGPQGDAQRVFNFVRLVRDDDGKEVTPVLTVDIAVASVNESSGEKATTVTVDRTGDTTDPLTVTLASSDTSEATLPATTTIPAGQAQVLVDLDAVDDDIVDGTQTVTVTASAAGFTAGSDTLEVTDDDEEEEELPDGYVVVDTGQVLFFGTDAPIVQPGKGEPFFGQDAHYSGTQMSYRDNGDATVTDLATGLMWQKDPGEKMTFEDAVSGADSFSLAGYEDWRLPSIKELYSLINFTGETRQEDDSVPYINTDYFVFKYGDEDNGERFIDAQYWSSTEYAGTTMKNDPTVFGVNFADGRIKGYPKEIPGGEKKEMFTQYLRGNEDYGKNQFMDNGDGTVTDNATGLMWLQDDGNFTLNWSEALAHAENFSFAGYDDWRLPNAKELQSIVDYGQAPDATNEEKVGPAIDSVFNITENASHFWTGTTHQDGPDDSYAAYVTFGLAEGWMEEPPDSGNYELMNVHGAGAQRSDPKSGDPDDYPQGHGPQGDVIGIYNYVRLVRG